VRENHFHGGSKVEVIKMDSLTRAGGLDAQRPGGSGQACPDWQDAGTLVNPTHSYDDPKNLTIQRAVAVEFR